MVAAAATTHRHDTSLKVSWVKVFMVSTAVVLAFLNSAPNVVKDATTVAIVLVIVDTIMGLWLAGRKGIIASRKMSEKLTAKLLQYVALIALFSSPALLMRNWSYTAMGIAAIASIEFVSIMENLVLLEKHGGVPLGPIRPLLLKMSRLLAISVKDKDKDDNG